MYDINDKQLGTLIQTLDGLTREVTLIFDLENCLKANLESGNLVNIESITLHKANSLRKSDQSHA